MSSALPYLSLSPCPLPARLGHPYPSAKPPPFLPLTHRSPSSGLAPWFSTLQELHCLCALPEPHKVVGSGGWPLWEDSGGSRTKHQDQGGKQALGFWGRTQTSPLRSREGLQTKTFFLQETPFLHLYSQQNFFLDDSPLVEIPPRTDPRAQ